MEGNIKRFGLILCRLLTVALVFAGSARAEELLDCLNPMPVELTLGIPYKGDTSNSVNNISKYGCIDREETGPEVVHTITTSEPTNLTAKLSELNSDLDVFILSACSENACVAYGNGDTVATFPNAPAGTYFLVVDGYMEAVGNYTLTVDFTPVVCISPQDCDDGNVCTDDICDPTTGDCTNTTVVCDDGYACNGVETCDAVNGCVPGTALSCDDGNACTDDHCDPQTGCVNTDISSGCEDGNACTDDSCDPESGCVNTNNNASCSDGDACNGEEVCSAGVCESEIAPNCAEEIPLSIKAEFNHLSQSIPYQTIISSFNRLILDPDENNNEENSAFSLKTEDCFAIASWESSGNEPQKVGPVVVCITNASVSEQEINSWMVESKKSEVNLNLVIPVKSSLSFDQIGLSQQQIWENTTNVAAQIFLRGCGDSQFRKYGNLFIKESGLKFTLLTDEKGQSQVDLSTDVVQLLDINSDTWSHVLTECDVEQVLSNPPGDGTSLNFSGTSLHEPIDPQTLFGQFNLIGDQIKILAFQSNLDGEVMNKLNKVLNKVASQLRQGKLDKAAHGLREFSGLLEDLANKGLIDPKEAEYLTNLTLPVISVIAGRFDLPDLVPTPLNYCSEENDECPDISSCIYTVFHVNGDSIEEEPDGSSGRPFSTIVDALARAEELEVCGVSLRVAPAVYVGDLHISRHIKILGSGDTTDYVVIQGSITNTGPYYLEISDVILEPMVEPANGLFVDNACAQTRLDDVNILGFRGFGILQRGGTLTANRTIVYNTRAHTDFLTQGTGIALACGTRARLVDVSLIRNETSGLLIYGAGTDVLAYGLNVGRTNVHPLANVSCSVTPLGAVHVSNEAHLVARGFRIHHNKYKGVSVNMRGDALLENGIIQDTDGLENTDCTGGMNAGAYSEGHLRLLNFITTRASLCGIHIARDGEMDLDVGNVSNNPVGACINVPGYDVLRLQGGGSVFYDNDTNVESRDFSIPEPSDPGL
jgi:hypothetical protein